MNPGKAFEVAAPTGQRQSVLTTQRADSGTGMMLVQEGLGYHGKDVGVSCWLKVSRVPGLQSSYFVA